MTCPAHHLFETLNAGIHHIVQKERGEPPGGRTPLNQAWRAWQKIKCENCALPECPFMRPTDWIECAGFTSLHDYLCRSELVNRRIRAKAPKSEALANKGARRPGHLRV